MQLDLCDLELMVEDFLDELAKKTGVSNGFLLSARPAVAHMFQTTAPDQMAAAKRRFEDRARSHFVAERHLKTTLNRLEALMADSDCSHDAPGMERLAFTKAVIVNSLLKTYGGFGAELRYFA